MHALIELSQVSVRTVNQRPLFEGLNLRIAREHVAIVGRNGVGKSTLLALIAGEVEADQGRVRTRSKPYFVPQIEARALPLSLGEQRRAALADAHGSGAEILLLDEPSEHLDDAALTELRRSLLAWPGCLLVATHDRRLLADFQHFFVMSEAGCRYFSGKLSELTYELKRDQHEAEQRYLRNLNRLAASEEHTLHVARRKARKKRHGRLNELDRRTPRILLNAKREQAQVSHGRLAQLREARLVSLRQWTQSTRRALDVSLALELPVPVLAPHVTQDTLVLRCVSARSPSRVLFESLDLQLGRQRVAVVGPNGSGKTTLLEIALGRRSASGGSASRDPSKIGCIDQGGAQWMLEESLLDYLTWRSAPEQDAAQLIVAHQFPLALAERPLCSLSPGERARAALICVFGSSPAPEVLVLDEPTFGLDLVGQSALTRALCAWPGGLLIASHDAEFLGQLRIERMIRLPGGGGQ